MKRCNVCGIEKPIDDFYPVKGTTTRVLKTTGEKKAYPYETIMNCCKDCHKEKQKYRLYGVCNVKYDEMLVKQKGGCAICGSTLNSNRYTKLAIDHNHKTGKVRGLLCSGCNSALGLMKESKERFYAAIRYLDLHENEEIVCSTGEPVAA